MNFLAARRAFVTMFKVSLKIIAGERVNLKSAAMCVLLTLAVGLLLPIVLEKFFPFHFSRNGKGFFSLLWVAFPGAWFEEIFFRSLPYQFFVALIAALLSGAEKKTPALHWLSKEDFFAFNNVFVFLSAAIFVLAHYVNFNMLQENAFLFPTFLTLFAFGVLTGALFVREKNLLLCLAIHAGWNIGRFQLNFYANGRILEEHEGFNLLEGNWAAVLVTSLLALMAVQLYWRRTLARHRFLGGIV